MDYKVHGILQARILEWVFLPFSRGASQTRDRTQVFHSAGGFFTSWVTREAGSEKTQKLTNKPMSLLIGKVKRRAKLSRLPWVQEFQEENGIKIGSVMWEIDYGGHTATSRGCLVQGVWDRDRICPFMLVLSGLPLVAPTDWIQVESSINRACDTQPAGINIPLRQKGKDGERANSLKSSIANHYLETL